MCSASPIFITVNSKSSLNGMLRGTRIVEDGLYVHDVIRELCDLGKDNNW